MGKFVHGVLLAALLAASGGPAAAVQAVAWTTMLLRFSQEGSFLESVQRTFSGDEPCRLCLRAEEMREGETPEAPGRIPVPDRFPDLFLAEVAELPPPLQGTAPEHPAWGVRRESRADEPRVGPPERA
jgi:hypothetical protein